MAMDFSYFDRIKDTIGSEPQIDTADEEVQLRNIADNIGSYLYEYNKDAQNEYNVDGKEHLGIVAQDLLRVPGLASAVHRDEYGNYVVDSQKVALAALGLVAALARKVIGTETGEIDNGTTSEELPSTVQDATGAATDTDGYGSDTSDTGAEAKSEPTTEDNVANVDTTEAVTDVADNE